MRKSRLVAAHAIVWFCLFASSSAFAKNRADCERVYRPTFSQEGKDVPWEPTSTEFAAAMLRLAKVTSSDRVYDLGAGDGVIVATAARQFGATAVGIEYNKDLAQLAQCYVEAEGLAAKAKVIQGDIFKTDFSSATVVTLYLWPEVNLRLRPILLKMPVGTRVVSHQHDMQAWKWDDRIDVDGRRAFLWIVPAQVEGTWRLAAADGVETITLSLKQKYQEVTGSAGTRPQRQEVSGGLRGSELNLDLKERGKLKGLVSGNRITATITNAQGERKYSGVLTK